MEQSILQNTNNKQIYVIPYERPGGWGVILKEQDFIYCFSLHKLFQI